MALSCQSEIRYSNLFTVGRRGRNLYLTQWVLFGTICLSCPFIMAAALEAHFNQILLLEQY